MSEPLPIAAYALPIAAGILFAVIGLAYRLGQEHGVQTPIVLWHMGCAGIVWFGYHVLQGGAPPTPLRVWTLGVSSGIGQTVCIIFVSMALARGPLSPIWCAMNLIFVPVIGYATIFLGQHLPPLQLLGVIAAISSVLIGGAALGDSKGDQSDKTGNPSRGWKQRIVYAVILLGALLSNSLIQMSISDLGGHDLMAQHGSMFFFLVYSTMILPYGIMFLKRRTRGVYSGRALVCGVMAAVGSVGGMALLGLSASYPASVVFTLSAIFSLVGGAIFSVMFFRERMSPAWFAMIGLATAAVVLVSFG